MLNGSILDVYPDYQHNVMVTWLLDHGKVARIQQAYDPHFYVAAPQEKLGMLQRILEVLPQVKHVSLCSAKLTLGSEKKTMVIDIVPKNLRDLQHLAAMIDAWGGFHWYQLFNVDLRLPSRYLFDCGVFSHAEVGWDNKRFILQDEQWAVDYRVPVFRIVKFDVQQHPKVKRSSFTEPITGFMLDSEVVQTENEIDTILSMLKRIQELDPDILATSNGDTILFPLLYHRAARCGITDMLHLGRDKKENALRPVKQAKSYFSYGRIIYRPAFYTLRGRLHLDLGQSFFYGESGLRGMLDMARCSNIPLQLLSRLGPGTAISQMEMNTAQNHGYLIPWKKTMPENWKNAEELLRADRGGLVLEPAVGLHEDVVELDYASLYPNIMLRYNISPETLLCQCCPDSPMRVPQLGYHICMRHTGLLPEVLKPILARRFCFKARAKNKHYDHELYKELQQAWKWVLVVCFGYTGYRNARYGRIECHESITAYSRDILLTAVQVAEHSGYRVLHGIIDSLWVQPTPGALQPSRLSRLISKQTGIRMDIEGRYHWIVFLPSKLTGAGALTRYYGMFEDGSLKIRGVELRQHNTPVFLCRLQQDMLFVLQQAHTSSEFQSLLPKTVDVLKTYAEHVRRRTVDPFECIFTSRVSRDVTGYKVNTFVKSALLQLRDEGIMVEPGQSVRYVVTDEHSRDYRTRVCVAETLMQSTLIDAGFYRRQLAQCAESLLTPFGYTREKLEKIVCN